MIEHGFIISFMWLLVYLACVAILIVGLRAILAALGIPVPEVVWIIVGCIVGILLLLLLADLLIGHAHAEEMPRFVQQPQVTCAPKQALGRAMQGPPLALEPLFDAVIPGQPPSAVSVFANAATGAWTMIASPDGKIACLVMGGNGFKPAHHIPDGPAL